MKQINRFHPCNMSNIVSKPEWPGTGRVLVLDLKLMIHSCGQVATLPCDVCKFSKHRREYHFHLGYRGPIRVKSYLSFNLSFMTTLGLHIFIQVYWIQKAIHGFKQSPRAWSRKFSEAVSNNYVFFLHLREENFC